MVSGVKFEEEKSKNGGKVMKGWWRSSPLDDWRPYVRPNHPRRRVVGGLSYEVVEHPAPTIEEPYVELAHAVIVQSLAPRRKISSALADQFVKVVSRVNFRKVVTANQVNALLASYVLRGTRDVAGGLTPQSEIGPKCGLAD